ncbi:MAG: hypothetical protein JXB35_16440, partial [Anaerolineae bacterium]|nr:hypothetical protein [Anaerolineae bacterium]
MAWDFFRRIRRNHALEHATITLLNRQHPEAQIVGFSGPRAVTLYTNLSVQEVYPAVKEALRLLKQGRRGLAIHPNCGTNLVTAAALTVLSTSLIMVPAAHSAQER